MHFKKNAYIFEYIKNPVYYFRLPIYAGVFGVFWLLIFLTYKAQQIRAKQKYESEKKIAELQIRSIKNQIDPHSTLNIINSIGTLFATNDPEKANYVFGKYAGMLRNTILNSENVSINLSKEIEYIRNYLDLEKFRLKDKFDYRIEVSDEIDQDRKIPKMLIHTFVENAIKHGIRHLEDKGELTVTADKTGKNIIVSIEDNGVGRMKAKDYSKFSTGKGLRILDQILELYLKIENTRITYEIIDKIDDNKEAAGTKVIINILLKTKAS